MNHQSTEIQVEYLSRGYAIFFDRMVTNLIFGGWKQVEEGGWWSVETNVLCSVCCCEKIKGFENFELQGVK